MKSDLESLARDLGPGVRRDEPLARHTAIRIGGPADLLVVAEGVSRVVEAVQLARRHGVPWRVLGGGCNVLVADAGVRGLVVIHHAAGVHYDEPACTVRAEAGALIAALAKETVERGWEGLQWASGLPGAVGGAVVGNAGAFEGDVASVLRSGTLLDPTGEVVERPCAWFEFDYRRSRLKGNQRAGGGYVLLAATFGLQASDPARLRARATEILEWRRSRHPAGATMGSTFKNPPGSHAGYLIEQAGLRGYRIGGAQISHLHGNFFMNTGTATAADVLALMEHARSAVREQFGYELEPEIECIGGEA